MHFLHPIVAATALLFTQCLASPLAPRANNTSDTIAPRVMIVSMFDPEADVWYGIEEFDLLSQNISLPGLSPLFPEVHCTSNGDVCQFTIGEGEINAATSVQSLVLSPRFDLTKTYFLIAGIAGINPEIGSTCSVTFARYAVQVALQYEFAQVDIPANFSYPYIPFGSHQPDEYPQTIYGTEVFEFNQNLQHMAAEMAQQATLNDSAEAVAYRANYVSDLYALGAAEPAVYECDVATSDVYFSGTTLSEGFGSYTSLITNGSGVYCTTAQEDNATGEALLRAALAKLVDFSRIIIMRTASDFDRPALGQAATTNLSWADQGAFGPAVENIYRAGIKVVEGILKDWSSTFAQGVQAENYVGDMFGTLGGKPDFGPSDSGMVKRGVKGRRYGR